MNKHIILKQEKNYQEPLFDIPLPTEAPALIPIEEIKTEEFTETINLEEEVEVSYERNKCQKTCGDFVPTAQNQLHNEYPSTPPLLTPIAAIPLPPPALLPPPPALLLTPIEAIPLPPPELLPAPSSPPPEVQPQALTPPLNENSLRKRPRTDAALSGETTEEMDEDILGARLDRHKKSVAELLSKHKQSRRKIIQLDTILLLQAHINRNIINLVDNI